MQNKEYSSPEEYAMDLSYEISKLGEGNMDSELLDSWCDGVYNLALESYIEYLKGNKETYLITDEDVKKCYEKASLKHTQELLDGLVDKGLAKVSVGENGDILYSLTEDGKKYANEL
jgi:hypothetical protein